MSKVNQDDVIRKICEAISGIKYGSLVIQVQDGRIVYIEKTEKVKVRSGQTGQG